MVSCSEAAFFVGVFGNSNCNGGRLVILLLFIPYAVHEVYPRLVYTNERTSTTHALWTMLCLVPPFYSKNEDHFVADHFYEDQNGEDQSDSVFDDQSECSFGWRDFIG